MGHVLQHRKKESLSRKKESETRIPRRSKRIVLLRTRSYPQGIFEAGVGGKLKLKDIEAFAVWLEIAPDIVVGRVQHEGILPYEHGNKLKKGIKLTSGHAP